jgi:N-acetylneuraminic acid mutarotase
MRKSAALLLVLVFLSASFTILAKPISGEAASEDMWMTKAPMHVARSNLGVAVVNGKIYAIGGNGGSATCLGTNEEYDPATDTWIMKTPMPTPRSHFAIAVFQNKIYCIGGGTLAKNEGYVTGVNEVYDPAADTWETKAAMPNARQNLEANVVRGKIYLVGGLGRGDPKMWIIRNDTNLNEVYDPVTDSWTTRTPMPNAASDYVSAVVDDKIYFMDGEFNNNNQVYEAKTDTWSSAAPVPGTTLNMAAAGATSGANAPKLIYVIGGYYGKTQDFDKPYNYTNQIYNPKNDSWSFATYMPIDNHHYSIAVVDDILYIIGGASLNNTVPYAYNLQYTPIGYGTPDPSYVPLNGNTTPSITVLSPENQTYYLTDIPLNLIVSEPNCWISYELDGETAGTFTGNASLTNLSQGTHALIVYATNAVGNTGSSMTIHFTVTPLPIWLIIVVLSVIVVISVGLLVYFKKRKS